ncbi:Autoinducer 2 sensor kinase/phosphatase LuxQ [Anatilimnocola aggregata]|uniref:histidine kinase n=1 Tax=Anatilimnocola aggregata TaxID=2528021 RepID=A0A517YAM3_9BACT|nr:ATP-binding protein [Anatilimnocola aggregata]QDU27285.1 Autoinducer 2 sensor kinase/phosphatase LuxQ [Anatilimnocola aggregata]
MSSTLTSKPPTAAEQRVLILAPTKRDGEISAALLLQEGITADVSTNIDSYVEELRRGAGALVLTEDALFHRNSGPLHVALKQQPAWSELPVIALVRNSSDGSIDRQLKLLGHVTLLERPVLLRTFVSSVQTALWARMRQYQIRDLLVKEREAREEAERTSRLKDEFIATLSHELRTPLSAILGWSQLLGRDLLDEKETREAVSSIERNARAQTQLIEDLLDMSRIISGKMRLDVQTADPTDFIAAAIETVRPAAAAKEIRLHSVLDPNAGPVAGDPNRLQQVIWNLLSNAIKFTPKGGEVKVILRRTNSHLEIAICDTGQGISAQFLPYVFDRFRQADGSTTRRFGGLGLGLAIVKQLVELHGGRVEAQSDGDGRGSVFVISLPITAVHSQLPAVALKTPASPSPRERKAAIHSLDGLKILAVDDEADALAIIERVLVMAGAQVYTSTSANDALVAARKFQPDLMVSDIGMPDVDGYELMQMVRGQGYKFPAIALTAFARSQDRTRSMLAGFVAHIAKPVEPTELIATVAAVAGRV